MRINGIEVVGREEDECDCGAAERHEASDAQEGACAAVERDDRRSEDGPEGHERSKHARPRVTRAEVAKRIDRHLGLRNDRCR